MVVSDPRFRQLHVHLPGRYQGRITTLVKPRLSGPAELLEPFVRDSEMMTDFVNDRDGDTVPKLRLVTGDSQMGNAEDGDAIRHHAAVGQWAPSGEADALVEPEQHAAVVALLCGRRPILYDYRDVFDMP